MASAQAPGAIIRLYVKRSNDDAIKVFEGVNEITGPGGSPDGAAATVKDNELPYMPRSGVQARGGDKILMTVELTAADGLDASDSVVIVPIQVQGKGLRNLDRTAFGYITDYPAGSLASLELPLGVGKEVPTGEVWNIGGGKYFISVEDDA